MNYTELFSIIRDSATKDWTTSEYDDCEEHTFKKDLNIHLIECCDDTEKDECNEQWAKQFADSNAYYKYVMVMYGASIVEKVKLVSVDGYKATVPIPTDGKKVSRQDYDIARVGISGNHAIDEYMERLGFTIN